VDLFPDAAIKAIGITSASVFVVRFKLKRANAAALDKQANAQAKFVFPVAEDCWMKVGSSTVI
jgi:hypothetical protein